MPLSDWRANCEGRAAMILPLALAALALQGSVLPKRPQEPVVAFVDVNVVPMNRDGVLEYQTVVVRGNRIVAVGPASKVRAPDGATTVNGSGKYLMPGFAEMHGHFPNLNAGPELTVNVLFLYVANGVTTVRGMQGQLPHPRSRPGSRAASCWAPGCGCPGPPSRVTPRQRPKQGVAWWRSSRPRASII